MVLLSYYMWVIDSIVQIHKNMHKMLLLLIFVSSIVKGQQHITNDSTYIKNVMSADLFRKSGMYDSCIYSYEKAFTISRKSFLSLYRSAKCYSEVSKNENALINIKLALELDPNYVCKWLLEDYKSFWKKREVDLEKIISYCDSSINYCEDKLLRDTLLSIFGLDQLYRNFPNDDTILLEFQQDSLWKLQVIIDSINTIKIEQIIAHYGHPTIKMVGKEAVQAPFFVIQHANLSKMEKYLPLFKNAAQNGDLPWSIVVMMIDRVLIQKGEKQLYGTQVRSVANMNHFEFLPIVDEKNIDNRRREVGLGLIEDYAKQFGIKYKKIE